MIEFLLLLVYAGLLAMANIVIWTIVIGAVQGLVRHLRTHKASTPVTTAPPDSASAFAAMARALQAFHAAYAQAAGEASVPKVSIADLAAAARTRNERLATLRGDQPKQD